MACLKSVSHMRRENLGPDGVQTKQVSKDIEYPSYLVLFGSFSKYFLLQ